MDRRTGRLRERLLHDVTFSIADLELRVQQLEAMRETEKAALLDAFRQIEELKRRLDFHYRKINRLEEADA